MIYGKIGSARSLAVNGEQIGGSQLLVKHLALLELYSLDWLYFDLEKSPQKLKPTHNTNFFRLRLRIQVFDC